MVGHLLMQCSVRLQSTHMRMRTIPAEAGKDGVLVSPPHVSQPILADETPSAELQLLPHPCEVAMQLQHQMPWAV